MKKVLKWSDMQHRKLKAYARRYFITIFNLVKIYYLNTIKSENILGCQRSQNIGSQAKK